MAIEIPTNTAIYIPVGPFLDKTDGITPELSITVANSAITLIAGASDETAPTIVLDSVAGNDATNTLVHITNDDAGMYYLKLTASNNNRYGKGMLVIEDTDTYVTVFHEIQWVSAQYNSMKYGTTILNTNITQISGDSDAADNCELMFDGTGYAGGATKLGVDVVKVSGDSDAADNLELAYDGTGYAGGTTKPKVDLDTIKTQSVTCAAGVTILANVGAAGAPGANNGLPTTNGTKLNQTVDLTTGQSIACSDKTGFALSATGADLILKGSTFVQAIVAAINEFSTYGLTALNTLLTSTGILLNGTQGLYAPAKAGDAMNLADDAITAGKFDETTAFPLKSADTGSTQVFRTGADSDTGETLSDQLDTAKTILDKVDLSASTIVSGEAQAGTLSTTEMTTNLTEATNDHYNGRIIIWTSGVLQNQATDITDYDGATKKLVFTAVTETPTAADTFIIV